MRSGVPLLPCGQFALVMLQTGPCEVSVQAPSTLLPPLEPVKTGPLADAFPSSSVASRSSTPSNALRSTFVWVPV